jgi:type II secretory pathway component PulC
MAINLSDRYIMALNVLLFAVLAYFAVLSVNDVLAYWRTPAAIGVAHTAGKSTDESFASRQRAAYQPIVERDIFNLVPPPAETPPVAIEELHLTLIGVSQSSKGKPFAIIADRTGAQSVYRVGEMIPNSGKLVGVEKDRAIVDHGGKQVALDLPKEDMSGPPSSGLSANSGDEPDAASGDDSGDSGGGGGEQAGRRINPAFQHSLHRRHRRGGEDQ